MFKKNNKFYAFILTLAVLVSALALPLNAMTISADSSASSMNTVIEPRWSNVASSNIVFQPSNGKISISVTIAGYAGTTFSNGEIILEKISGTNCGTVATWSNLSSNNAVYGFNNKSYSYTSGEYKLTITITATKNGTSEIIKLERTETF